MNLDEKEELETTELDIDASAVSITTSIAMLYEDKKDLEKTTDKTKNNLNKIDLFTKGD